MMAPGVLLALLLAQDLPGAKTFEKAAVRVAAVRPERQAGEVVKVAFDLEIPEKWHIYPVGRALFGAPTIFTFEGAAIAGLIEQPTPKVREEKALNLKYDYHEGKVTVTVPLRPAAATVKGRIDYQICDANTCIQNSTPFSFALGADPDDPPPVKVVSVKTDKDSVKAGEVFKATFTVEVPKDWHIYPTYELPSKVGLPTQFLFEALEPAGKPEESRPKVHPAKGTEPEYEYHDGTVTFTVPFTVKPGPKPGPLEAKGQVDYMICQFEGTCVPSDVAVTLTLNLLEGQVAPPAAAAGSDESFLVMLGFAFLGGFILNVMPCVLPVLMIKLFSLVKQKNAAPGVRQGAALAYTAGVLACLLAFAGVVIVLKQFGRLAGWGFQFQEPAFVIALATLIFVFALSLLGVFHIPAMATGAAAQAGRHQGWLGHVGTGFFVTLVATPCSAPLLGSAMGFAFRLPEWGIVLFFSTVALGLAFPFLIIGFFPVLMRFMPKPGAWLEVFERIMGFTLLATVVWLVDTLGSLTGKAGVTGMLAFLTAVALGCWVFGTWGSEIASLKSKLLSLGAAVLVSVLAGSYFLVTETAPEGPAVTAIRIEGLSYEGKIPWQPFSEENVETVRKARKPGFVDFTADW